MFQYCHKYSSNIELICLEFAFLDKFCVHEDFVGPGSTSQFKGSIALLLCKFITRVHRSSRGVISPASKTAAEFATISLPETGTPRTAEFAS